MSTFEILLIVLIIILLGVLLALVLMLLKSKNNNSDLRVSLNKDLLNFSNKLNNDFNKLNTSTLKEIYNLEDKVNKNILESSKLTNDNFLKLSEKMIKIDEAQKSLNELSTNIVSLESILQDKKSRGTFGEIELYSILELAFGNDYTRYQKQYTLPNNCKVDAVIFGGDNLGLICVDSKFPLENYQRMYDDNLANIDRQKAKINFKNDVLKHLNDIKNKYIIPGVTSPMAYMFVPSEAIFAEIYANYDEIVNKSYQAKVYIVSPTTLMAYLTAIRSIYLGQIKNEKAKEIEKLLNELSIEFSRLKDRNETLQRDFEKIIPDFERVQITSNKIIKKFAQISSGEIDEND